jgi:hypothetical protein
VLILTTGLCGCAQPGVRQASSWQDSAARDHVLKKVIVVGVSPDINQRCNFEYVLAAKLSTDSTTAIPSCNAMQQKEPLTRESIEQAVAAEGADGVVATSLIDKKWELEQGGSRDTRGGAYYKATDAGYATGYYGVYGVPVVYGEFQTAAPITTLQGEVQVTTKVWETRGPTIVYTLDTTARDLQSSDQGLLMVANAIADRLRRDGLTR